MGILRGVAVPEPALTNPILELESEPAPTNPILVSGSKARVAVGFEVETTFGCGASSHIFYSVSSCGCSR